MKKLFPFALIAAFAIISFSTSCKKSSSSSSSGSGSMTASIAGNSWSATIDSAWSPGGSGLWIYGYSISGSSVQYIEIMLPTAPTAAGDIAIDGSTVTAAYGSNTGAAEAVNGTVHVSSISSSNVTGTFSFTCTDSTKVTGGSFNLARH